MTKLIELSFSYSPLYKKFEKEMNRKTIHQPLETFVILPYNDYKLLCQKIEKAERGSESPSLPHSADLNDETVMNESSELKDEESVKSDVKKDLTSHYRSSHIKKMIKHIEKLKGSDSILELENLDALIRTALNQSLKKVPREEEFFNFLFSNGLGQYVKNRSKIDLYSPEKDSWYHI